MIRLNFANDYNHLFFTCVLAKVPIAYNSNALFDVLCW